MPRRRSGGHETDDELLDEDEITASILGYDESAMRQDQGGRPPETVSENRHMARLREALHARTRRLLYRRSRGGAARQF
ncbi:hypothetical protein [Actinomadura sp. WMMA1423]|uniref:hypothetical protein n=1 Tax=Actinomadura sp. WMMA1423 TaxID=2591108 RepID=UPI001147410F|nr:hypothetical protein [Actinomadura sp. WMMA1423]